jgi:hypothetical protein
MLIGVSGKFGSGKDYLAENLKKLIRENFNREFEIQKFAKALKENVAFIADLDVSKCYEREGKEFYIEDLGMTIGQLHQAIGEGLRKSIDPNLWIIKTLRNYNESKDWIVSDLRYKNEFEVLRHLGGFLIRIEGESVYEGSRDRNHISEIDLDDWIDKFDHVIFKGSRDLNEYDVKNVFDDIFYEDLLLNNI